MSASASPLLPHAEAPPPASPPRTTPSSRRSLLAGLLLLTGAATALALLPVPAASQEDAFSHLLRLPASTRAMALGDAFMTDAGSAEGIFYHPALVSGASGFGIAVQSWGGVSTAAHLAAATDWFGGSVAVGLQTLQYDRPAEDFTLGEGLAQDPLFQQGPWGASERVATVAYGRESAGLRWGVAGKVVEQRLTGADQTAWAVDLGVAREVGPLTVALSAQNLGTEMDFVDFGDESVALPRRYTLGAGAYGREVGPLDVGFSGSLRYEEQAEEWIPGAGLEVGYWPVRGRTFVGRVGVQRVPEGEASGVTFGAAFWGDDLTLEWAWMPFGGAVDDGTHRIGIGWR